MPPRRAGAMAGGIAVVAVGVVSDDVAVVVVVVVVVVVDVVVGAAGQGTATTLPLASLRMAVGSVQVRKAALPASTLVE